MTEWQKDRQTRKVKIRVAKAERSRTNMANCALCRKLQRVHKKCNEWLTSYWIPGNAVPTVKQLWERRSQAFPLETIPAFNINDDNWQLLTISFFTSIWNRTCRTLWLTVSLNYPIVLSPALFSENNSVDAVWKYSWLHLFPDVIVLHH